MILRLNPFLTKVTQLFADPVGAPAGDGGAGPAATNEGGGGGGPGGDTAAVNEFADFTPPDIDFGALSGKAPAEPEPKAGEKPTPAPKPAEPAPKPGEKPVPAAPVAKDPPAALLRKELETNKAELAELKLKYEAGDPRIKQAEEEVKATRAELEAANARVKDYETKLAVMDPRVTKQVENLDAEYDKDAGKFFARVPELSAPDISSLTREYSKLPFGKEGYKEALQEFEAAVNRQLGGDGLTDHKRLPQALDMIEKTYEFLGKRRDLESSIRKDALSLRDAADAEEHGKTKTFISEKLKFAEQVPEELAKTQPFHPKVVLKNVLDAMTPEQKTQTLAGVNEFIELAMGGIRLKTDSEYPGMTKEQISEARDVDRQKIENARGGLVDIARNGVIALRVVPSLMKEIQRLEAALKAQAGANPPDPTAGAEGGGGGGDASDIKEFKAPPVRTSF